MTRKLKVLVLSDRFPPEVQGGAELSLRDTLRAIPAGEIDIRILAFSDAKMPGPSDSMGDIPIQRTYQALQWPPHIWGAWRADGNMSALLRAAVKDAGANPRSLVRVGLLGLLHASGNLDMYAGLDSKLVNQSDTARDVLIQLIRDWKPDVIHADNTLSILLAASIPGSIRKAPLVAMVRDHRFFCGQARQSMVVSNRACTVCNQECADRLPSPLKQVVKSEMRNQLSFRRDVLASTNRILTTSRYISETLKEIGIPVPAKAIGNPHPLPNAQDMADQPGEDDENAARFLFAGNVRREKGAILIADLFAELNAIPDIRITFAGNGPDIPEIRAKAKAAGMAEQVDFTGFLNHAELMKLFRRSRAILTPTIWPEPFGRVPLEAGVNRRAVIASAHGGHLETVVDEKTGLLVPPGSRNALGEAIFRLAKDPVLARNMGQAAERHVQENFAPSLVAGKLAEEWERARAEYRKRSSEP